MEFKVLQQKIIKNVFDYGKKNNIKIDQEFASLKLFEETGEFAQALLIHQNRCRTKKRVSKDLSKQELVKELADVIGMAIVNAHFLGIDLEKAIKDKWIDRKM